jgi:hypothetical protein
MFAAPFSSSRLFAMPNIAVDPSVKSYCGTYCLLNTKCLGIRHRNIPHRILKD